MPRSYALYQEMRWLPGRLLERVNKKKSTKKRTSAVEFRYADVEVDAPVEFEGGNASVVQSNLEASDLVGARLDANLDLGNSTPDLPSYLLTTEDGRTVGRTSDVFNEAFVKAFGLTDGRWPAMLTGLSVVSIETVAGDPRKSQQMDISFAGLWLAPRVVGLAQPDWSMMEEVQ